MKTLLAIVLFIATLLCVNTQSASFGQSLAVTTSLSQYSFLGGLMTLYVSSPSAGSSSNVVVNSYSSIPTNIPSASLQTSVNNGFPAGYAALSTGLSVNPIGAGLSITFSSDINGNANATLSFSSQLTAQVNITSSFRILAFNGTSNLYYVLPANQYAVSQATGLAIYTTSSISIVLAVSTPVPYILNIANNATIYATVVANQAVNFTVQQGTYTALYIYNLVAAAGTVSVGISANAANEAVVSGNLLISGVYNFTHSAGSNAVSSAQLSYNINNNGGSYNSTIMSNAAWYYYTNGAWVQQSSSVNGGVVVYNTNHFSDWSVQSSNSGSSSPTNTASAYPSHSAASSLEINTFVSRIIKAVF